jgi:hypothetical protein
MWSPHIIFIILPLLSLPWAALGCPGTLKKAGGVTKESSPAQPAEPAAPGAKAAEPAAPVDEPTPFTNMDIGHMAGGQEAMPWQPCNPLNAMRDMPWSPCYGLHAWDPACPACLKENGDDLYG